MLCHPSKIATATSDFSRKRQKKKRIRDVAILSLTPEKNQQISETILFIEVQILACAKFWHFQQGNRKLHMSLTFRLWGFVLFFFFTLLLCFQYRIALEDVARRGHLRINEDRKKVYVNTCLPLNFSIFLIIMMCPLCCSRVVYENNINYLPREVFKGMKNIMAM